MKITEINWENGRIRELRFITEMNKSSIILVSELYSDIMAEYRKRVDIVFHKIITINLDFDIKEIEANSHGGNIQKGVANATSLDIELLNGRLQIIADDIEVVRS